MFDFCIDDHPSWFEDEDDLKEEELVLDEWEEEKKFWGVISS